jgi:hypothetical protein
MERQENRPTSDGDSAYLSTDEAAKFLCSLGLRTAKSTLNTLRSLGGGPKFRKHGRRPVYTRRSLQEFANTKLTVETTTVRELAAA